MQLQIGNLRLALPAGPDGHVRPEIAAFFARLGLPLEKAAKGAEKAGHKYIRRVMGPDGKYHYVYSEAGTAHAVQEGERINLRQKGVLDVLKVEGDTLHVRDTATGNERRITLADLHAELHAVYADAFERGAERMVKRFAAEASKAAAAAGAHNDAAAMRRAYAERFQKARVDAKTAERLVGFLAPRQGWSSEAKAALLALASDVQVGRSVAPRARSIARGAENLARRDGSKVEPKHVGTAAALRAGRDGADAEGHIAGLRAQAQAELAKAKTALGAIEAAGNNDAARKAMVAYAKTVMGQDAVLELQQAAQAYPGLRELPELAELQKLHGQWQAILAQHAERTQDAGLGRRGAETTVFVADADGSPTPQRARYRLVEASQAVASHDPTRNFGARREYPEGVQERAYHRDKGEQDKVRTNARKLQPAYVVNTNPDAVNGPPVMTPDGVVLGGNSRTMSLQLAYEEHPEAAKRYRDYLGEHAHEFGFTEADLAQFERPILVREVDVADAGKDALGVLVRQYNESFTQAMDPRTDQVARGRLVNRGMLDMLAHAMDEPGAGGEPKYPTLNAYLTSAEGRRFVNELSAGRNGKSIIDRRNRSLYVGKDGKLNEDGKTFVERVLVGHVINDADLLSEMLPSQVEAIARSVPHVVRAAGNGHDVREALKDALYAHSYMRRAGIRSMKEYEGMQTLGGFAKDAGFDDKPELNPVSRGILRALLERPGPVQLSGFFRDFAEQAKRNAGGGTNLFGESMSTEKVMDSVYSKPQRGQQADMFKAHVVAQAAARAFDALACLDADADAGAVTDAVRRGWDSLPAGMRKALGAAAWAGICARQAEVLDAEADGRWLPLHAELAKAVGATGYPAVRTAGGRHLVWRGPLAA